MRSPKLNLSFYRSFLLALCFLYQAQVCGQPGVVHVIIKDGKVEITSGGLPKHPLANNKLPFPQRNLIINSLSLSLNTFGSTCNANNGSIVAVASGGTAPYTYTLSNGWVLQSGNFPSLAPGTYTVSAADATGQTVSGIATIPNTFSELTFAPVTYQNTTGCTTNDASVTLSANGGTPPYQYSIDGINYQASNTFSNLYGGFYNFTVKDANGCTFTYNSFFMGFLFFGPCENSFGLSYTEQVCTNEGFIIGGALGPNAPYFYSLDGINYQSTMDFSNLTSGLYTLYVKDVHGTIRIIAFSMRQNCYIRIDYVTVDAACLQSDGVLTATASNGTAPYTYTIDGINYQSSNVFSGLAAGNYFVTVKDANGYTSSTYAVLYDRCPVVSLSSTGESCALNDGTIIATATRGTAPYQYSIDGVNFQTSNVFTNLAAGPYTITLKDALGFSSTETITVLNACLSVSAVASSATCGNNNGSITATASNGTPPYQYSLDAVNFQVSAAFGGLAPGPYIVTVKDNSGKTGTTTIIVQNTPVPQINAISQPAFCSNNNGSVNITGTGGTGILQFSIDGTNYQNANVFANLASGPYTTWVKDATGCMVSQSVTIAFNCPAVVANWSDETCSNGNAIITVSATGATAPYLYSIDGTNFQGSNIFSGINAGIYIVTVKDALGATNSTTATIANICPTVTATVTDGLCADANGVIAATGANGTAPYQYSIDGLNFQASNSFTNLTDGIYTITVKDANGLTNTTSATVQNFPAPVVAASNTPSSCLNNDGSITITATGTSPYQYAIGSGPFLTNQVFNGIASGTYTVKVKDSKGCITEQTVTVPVFNNLSFNHGNNPVICEGTSVVFNCSSNATVFNWSPPTGLINSGQLNPTASPAVTTKYYVTATLGLCTGIDSVTVSVDPAPIADGGQVLPICFGQDAQLNGSGGNTYQWTPATYLSDPGVAGPVVIHPLTTITYSLEVTDANNCHSIQPSIVTVNVTASPKVFAGNDTAVIINRSFQLNAEDVNNSGFTQYTWTPPFGLNNDIGQHPVATPDRDMTYTVTAITQAGCQGTDEIKIKVYKGPEIYVPTAFTPNNDTRNDILKAIPVGIKLFKYFAVFNRWGQRIFYTNDAARGWDGKVNSIGTDTNTFVWMAEGTDDAGNLVRRKGTVTLIR